MHGSKVLPENGNPVDGLDAEKAGVLRAKRIETMVNVTPLMMLANVVNATVVVFLLGSSEAWIMFPWALTIYVVAGIGLVHWNRSRNRERIDSVSERGLVKAAKGAAILGAFWGVLPALFYPISDYQSKLVIIAVTSGMLGGGALALYVVPPAINAWILTITIGGLIGLLASGHWEDWAIASLLIVFALSLWKASNSMSKTFASNVVTKFELAEQSETIGLLLKEYTDNASDWLWELDSGGRFVRGASEFARQLAIEIDTIDPSNANAIASAKDESKIDSRSLGELWDRFNKRESFHDLEISSKKPGVRRWVSMSGKPLINAEGTFCGYRGFASNITEKKLTEERIAYLAHNDALTGLVNRASFSAALQQKFNDEKSTEFWAVLFLDLDGFKHVNDVYGHGIGDCLLTEVARRLKQTVEDCDIVARLGGDEFAVVCSSAVSLQTLTVLSEKLIKCLSESYEIEDLVIEIGVSIGVAIGIADGCDQHTLLNNADLALYRAKEQGKGTFRFYKLEMDEIVKDRRNLERDLRSALKNEELELFYQPLVSSDDFVTVGFEALLRWNHPSRGEISPTEFVPIAERIGLISEIGEWVVIEACKQASTWPHHLTVAVNLSAPQFHEERIVKSVTKALVSSGIDPERLEIEITEGLFIDNTREVIRSLRELKNMGVSIAMDDFGTGYSSLSYLLKFPFDKLKIDRSFVTSVDTDEVAKNVFEAIVKLANVLELTVTAEGVETTDQLDVLNQMNCTRFQGFAFGHPMRSSELPAFLLREFNANVLECAEREQKLVQSDDALRSAIRYLQSPAFE